MVKRSFPLDTPLQSKLNLYKSLMVSIVTYASPCWRPSKGSMRKLEQFQRRVVKWILPGDLDYTARLHLLKVLPLPLYMQMMDVIMFSKLCTAHYSINTTDVIMFKPNSSRNNTGFELYVRVTRLEKTQQEFFLRTSKLINQLPASLDVFNAEGLKSRLLSYIWGKFAEEFLESNCCT